MCSKISNGGLALATPNYSNEYMQFVYLYYNLFYRTFKLWGERFMKYFMIFDLTRLFHMFNKKELDKLVSDGVTITKPAMEVSIKNR